MRKFSIYSLLVASVLFTTGCSEKNVDMNVDNKVEQSSETALNNIPDTNINEITDGSFSMGEKTDTGVYYVINGKKVFIDNIYFGFDKYNLTDVEKSKAISNASKLSVINPSSTVKVSGNTDEWGTDEYNYALGLKRAKAVKDVLSTNGVTANISLVSLGESNPVCTEKNSACWEKNRRVEHTLIK
ncbi:peptidoglycan-associated lipoprotein [Malaciobacter pacificus]|jgi:peptidoglycan-associated lipoprotein|uniref:Tol-Pal system peptidoglycan-associated lipoprotein n=1 Tax=Malaciobacter pacificus TaxID=1080223 RepID=A0A5C2HEX8_9BACT|nr:OmpA family protein [Malaciobacter pacificus]QEP34952.1 Tol-Pal system peptidoglycan-associated lipoprotein [Malaciobacter pacificus]GGD42729.1 peptidoglycan-associated lipoprotein [Malaciobacter pacificus]